MSETKKFTFRNYVKEVKKCWLLLVIFLVIGAAAGAWYAFKKPVQYYTTAKFSVYGKDIVDNNSNSPYAQVGEFLMSKKVLADVDSSIKVNDLAFYVVKEVPHGVFVVSSTADTSDAARNTANAIVKASEKVANKIFDEEDNITVTVLRDADEPTPTVTTSSRIISIAIAAAGALALALVIIFIKFDFTAEK